MNSGTRGSFISRGLSSRFLFSFLFLQRVRRDLTQRDRAAGPRPFVETKVGKERKSFLNKRKSADDALSEGAARSIILIVIRSHLVGL